MSFLGIHVRSFLWYPLNHFTTFHTSQKRNTLLPTRRLIDNLWRARLYPLNALSFDRECDHCLGKQEMHVKHMQLQVVYV